MIAAEVFDHMAVVACKVAEIGTHTVVAVVRKDVAQLFAWWMFLEEAQIRWPRKRAPVLDRHMPDNL